METEKEINEFKKTPLYHLLTATWGGRYWSKDGVNRIYFGSTALKRILDVQVHTTQSGALYGVSYGEDMLSPEAGSILIDTLSKVKLYYDFYFERMCLDYGTYNHDFDNDLNDLKKAMQEYIDAHYGKGGGLREKS